MTHRTPALVVLSLLLAALPASCGARSGPPAPDIEPGAGGGGGAPPARSCLPNCTIGHQCCVGGCGGPAAATETDCCTCLEGEVNSSMCPGATCAGEGEECTPAGGECESWEECCSGYCDYPSAEAVKKSCLLI